MRYLGLDVGDRRIGLSLSDPTGLIASPLKHLVIDSDNQALDEVAKIVEQYKVDRVLVGMPYTLAGQIGPAAESVQEFIDALVKRICVPVVAWDERLSTVAAQRSLSESGVKRKRQEDLRDAVAAALILQGYLDNQRSQTV
jgi:putative Holliday junction resolvase